MKKKFTVYMDSDPVGEAEVEQQGLYYCIRCRCFLKSGKLFRLYAGDQPLGILAPEEGMLTLTIRKNRKSFSPENIRFQIIADGQSMPANKTFIPLLPGQPVNCLTDLESARFSVHDGVRGLMIIPEK